MPDHVFQWSEDACIATSVKASAGSRMLSKLAQALSTRRVRSPGFPLRAAGRGNASLPLPPPAAMDFVMGLDDPALTQLRGDFDAMQRAKQRGLRCKEFVLAMLNLRGARKQEANGALQATATGAARGCCHQLTLCWPAASVVVDLCELFDQIDLDGDGTVEWEDFTVFCVEAANAATRRQAMPAMDKVRTAAAA